ncbi:MAG TPA: hypothetical protein DHW80_06875 [Acinetobacter sp.]|nr:hypothetical protein [Acinetobacter sp.]
MRGNKMIKSNSKVIGKAMQSKTEEFIQKAIKVHGFKYDYSKVFYIKAKNNVEIICPEHGLFSQRADCHLIGRGCPKCSGNNKLKKEDFIKKAENIHGKRYDYSKSIYINNNTKLEIICLKHGSFYQRPCSHFNGSGCADCSNEELSQRQKMDTKKFIKKAREKHGALYSYSLVRYQHCKIEISIVCRKHGVFQQKPYLHLNGSGCHKCAAESQKTTKRDTLECFIAKAKKAHGEIYNYSEVVYLGNRIKVKIECSKHGFFEQAPRYHIAGAGCQKCAVEFQGFQRSSYIKSCEKYNGASRLYIIKCFDEGEEFYKVGITATTLAKRFRKGLLPYKYELIELIENEAGFIWDMEKQIHRMLIKLNYRPLIKFDGDTECFSSIPKSIFKMLIGIKYTGQLQLTT